jgi:hypothetical protein
MNKKENTLLRLEAALERILKGEPQRVLPARNLSIRAIEIESGLGNGSAYYYPEIILKIEKIKQEIKSHTSAGKPIPQSDKWKHRANEAGRLKEKFRNEVRELKTLNAQIAADQYKQMSALKEALLRISELEKTIKELNTKIIDVKRKNITLL